MSNNMALSSAGQGLPEKISAPELIIRKSGNLLDISPDGILPLPVEVRRLLEPVLRYTKKKFLYGAERYNPFTGERDRRIDVLPKRCYKYDAHGRLVTNFGFARRIIELLLMNGYEVKVLNKDEEVTDHCNPELTAVRRHFDFRQQQEYCLEQIITNPCGVIHAPTGFGKLVLIAMTCLAFPGAKIDVVTRRAMLVNKIASFLTRYIANIGQYGAGSKTKGRVTVYTAASLHHSDFDADIVLVDEAHELLADDASRELAQYQRARLYAFTASPIGRLDGTDIRMEALFGWTIFHLSYPQAVKMGLVVPVRVEWSDVCLPTNPCAGLSDHHRKRWGIWQNQGRNAVIAKKMLSFGEQDQVLAVVDTIEHAVHLWQPLREHGYVLVYNEMDEGDMRAYRRAKLLPEDLPEMTAKLREHYRQEFEAGRLKRVISTMWDVGIDPVQLTALVRADAGDAPIDDVQAPGRVARVHLTGEKSVGIVCDFRDQFDANYRRRAEHRQQRYMAVEWEQVITKSDGSVVPLLTG